ncbi:MAG TPA: YdcF family protein [Candidatus Saccharimonadia bacterium]|jgi:hypothetical protein
MVHNQGLKLAPSQAAALFVYLSQPIGDPAGSDLAIVFGRHDPRPAQAAANLWHNGSVQAIVATGGKAGKDRGALGVLDLAEATYVAAVLTAADLAVPVEVVHVEDQAANGFENAERSIELIKARGLTHTKIVLVAHATSLSRLYELFKSVARRLEFETEIAAVPSAYSFDPTSPADQAEALAELDRLVTWPAKGWLDFDPNTLPRELMALAM